MKQFKLNVDEKILARLEELAAEIGMSPQEYARMIIGKNVIEVEKEKAG